MTITRTDLSELMHALAEKGHARAAELREKADAFDAATHGFVVAQPQTHTVKQVVGSWARARRVHCECTGAPLI
jgi:uncharacterized iron-regulated protein